MTDEQRPADDEPQIPGGAAPFEEEADEAPEMPRRAASAQFVVESEPGSEAVLREAMDPANQSLAEALRLSFRILQVVILVLVMLFLASGFQNVDDGQSGVLTVWGKIASVDGEESLAPGFHWSRWPYPVGEFVLFDVENRSITLERQFWPRMPPGLSVEEAASRALPSSPLMPGLDGSVITSDAAIAHFQLSAKYEIVDPAEYIQVVGSPDDADHLVALAVERAAVHVTATMSVQELIDRADDARLAIQQRAQVDLDDVGIALEHVTFTEGPYPPLAIQRVFGDLQQAKIRAERLVENARQDANEILIDTAGENYPEIIQLIDAYEEAFELEDDALAETRLDAINAWMESEAASGDVSEVIKSARGYMADVEATYGKEARRFASLEPTFRQHPDLVVRERWMDVYARVLDREGVEIYYAPAEVGGVKLILSGLDEVQNIRRRLRLQRLQAGAFNEDMLTPFILNARDVKLEGPGRRLKVKDGKVVTDEDEID